MHESGETSHRQHSPHGAFVDGHCACIEAAYREYQLSPDAESLKQTWPGVKKSVDWLIESFDKEHHGVPMGRQINTYDCAVSGRNTFIGSQYLSALAAAERLAVVMNDSESAARWRVLREIGMKNQDEHLWNGEYYIQIPAPQRANDYNNGCHSDPVNIESSSDRDRAQRPLARNDDDSIFTGDRGRPGRESEARRGNDDARRSLQPVPRGCEP